MRRGLVASTLAVGLGAAIAFVPAPSAGGHGAKSAYAASCPASHDTSFGEPVWVLGCHIGGQGFTSPTVGTIDGTKVVVDASLSGEVYVVNALTGKEMPGWPERADLVGSTATAIDSSPAIAYLDGPDAEPSIVVGLGSLYVKDQNGGLMAWRYNGKVRFRFKTRKTFGEWPGAGKRYSDAVFSAPAIGDITGNGQPDIVFGSYDHYLYALNASGKLVKGFPVNRADTIWSSPALVDTTHTGRDDIIEGGDSSGWRGPKGGPKCYNGWLSDYRYESGKPKLVWEHCVAEAVWSSPAVSTFGTKPVVVVGTSWYSAKGRKVKPAEDQVFAYDALNGKKIAGWPVNAGGPTFGSPAISPLRPGGPNAVIESSCADCLKGPATVSAWTAAGKLVWRDHIAAHSQLLASPSVAALNGGSSYDVIIGNVNGLYVLSAATGARIDSTASKPINSGCNVGGTAAVSPVPGSKTGYMLFTNCGFAGGDKPANEFLRGYSVPAPLVPAPWPMFRANADRTGVADPVSAEESHCTAPASPAGYEVAGDSGAVLGYGSSGKCGSLGSELLPAPVAGIAETPDAGGYWVALSDGAVYAFGDAKSYGDLRYGAISYGSGDAAPGAPLVGIASTTDGKGYYLLGGDGSVYAFGDASYRGAPGRYKAAGRPVGIALDSATGGYWVATSTGHVYGYDAGSFGSTPTHTGTVVGIAALPDGSGYFLATSTGEILSLGLAPHEAAGSGTVVGIASDATGNGGYLLTASGSVERFGSAPVYGSPGKSLAAEKPAAIVAP